MNIKFVASILAKGNHVFQASITILDDGVKVKVPGFWRDKETYLTYDEIKGIELNTPSWYSVLTYSTISFFARGIRVEAHGFTTSDAKKIKCYIEDGQRGKNKDYGRNSDYRSSYNDKYYSEEEAHLDELIRQASSRQKEQLDYFENELIEALVAIEFVADDDKDEIVEINIKANKARHKLEDIYRNSGANWRYNFDAAISNCYAKADRIIEQRKTETNFSNNEALNDDYFEIRKPLRKDISGNEKNHGHVLIQYQKRTLKAIKNYDELNITLLELSQNVNKNQVPIRQFSRNIIDPDKIEDYKSYLEDDIESDGTQYSKELMKLLLIIETCYFLSKKMNDKSYRDSFRFGLTYKNIQSFLKDKEVSPQEKISKIIDCVDNLIQKYDDYLTNQL